MGRDRTAVRPIKSATMFSFAARLSVALLAALIVVIAADDVQTLPAAVFANERASALPTVSPAATSAPTVGALPASAVDVAAATDALVPDASAPEPSARVEAAEASVGPSVTSAPARTPVAPATAAPPRPTPQPLTPTAAPVPPSTAAPSGCPSSWFCYPRLAVAGPIVAYTDCGGSTDIGTSIRAFTCLSPNYLMGHAYTQFGKITQWQAGDVVYAYGRSFTITDAITARSCDSPPLPLAPLSMQTSLSPYSCGAVLVVQAR